MRPLGRETIGKHPAVPNPPNGGLVASDEPLRFWDSSSAWCAKGCYRDQVSQLVPTADEIEVAALYAPAAFGSNPSGRAVSEAFTG